MNSIKSSLILATVALTMTGCKSFGPAKIQIQSNQQAVLEQPSKKRQVQLTANQPVEVKVSGDKDELEFKFQDTKIVFKKPTYNKDEGTVAVQPENSGVTLNGQKAGLYAIATLVDQKKETLQERRTCTYYEDQCHPVCYPRPGGGTSCGQQCYQRPRNGWETVEHQDTYSTYNYFTKLITSTSNLEVSGKGQTTFVERKTRTIFPCF